MPIPDFIKDGTSLYNDKVDQRPPNNPDRQWAAADAALVKNALLSIQLYLRSGSFTATPSLTIADFNLTNNTSPSVGPEMDFVGFSGDWFLGLDVANSPTSRDFVVTGQRVIYSFPDGTTTSGSPTLTSASGGNFVAALVGAAISGVGIPVGTTITAVSSLTSLTMSVNATATASGVNVTIASNLVQDLMYWKHRGGLSATLGIGVTPPDGRARLQVSAQDNEPAMGTQRIRVGPSQTGNALTIHDSSPTDQWWIDATFFQSGAAGVKIQAESSASGHALILADNTKSNQYEFALPTGAGNVLRLRYATGPVNIFDFGTDGSVRHLSNKIGFFLATPVVKPTVTGSRGGNAALASLLTALQGLGLITDSTTA